MSYPTKRPMLGSLFTRPVSALAGRIFYGWWIVILGSLINAVGGGIFFHGFTVLFLPLKNDFHVSSAAISLLYAAGRLEGGFDSPIVGHLISRCGPRAIIIAGVSMAGGGLLLLSLAQNYWSFFFLYIFIVSLGYNAGFFHPVTTAVNNWFIRHRGVGFAWVSASANMGGMILTPILSAIIQDQGWQAGAITAGIIILAIGLPAAIPIRRSPEAMGLRPDGGSVPHGLRGELATGTDPAGVDFSVREALRTRAYWMLTGTISLRLFITVALNTHFVPIAVWGGMTETAAAYLVSLYAFGSILATVALGWLGDRWSKPLLCGLGLVPMILAMGALLFTRTAPLLYFFALALAVAMGTAPLNWAVIGDFFGRRNYPTLRGLMGLSYGATTFLSPIYAGWVYDATGSYSLVLLTFSVILLMTVCCFALVCVPPPPRHLGNA